MSMHLPQRIVCLTEETTEWLYLLGQEHRIVGISGYTVLAWQSGNGLVLGTYLHGLLETPAVLQALFGAQVPTLESVLDGLADYIERHFAPGTLPGLIGPG